MSPRRRCAECDAPLDGSEDFEDVCMECDSLGVDYELDEPLDENE